MTVDRRRASVLGGGQGASGVPVVRRGAAPASPAAAAAAAGLDAAAVVLGGGGGGGLEGGDKAPGYTNGVPCLEHVHGVHQLVVCPRVCRCGRSGAPSVRERRVGALRGGWVLLCVVGGERAACP